MRSAHVRADTAARLSVEDLEHDLLPTAGRLARHRRHRIRSDPALREAHRRSGRNLLAYVRGGDVPTLLITPIIYSLIVPFVLLDVWVWVYQWVCFPVYGIARVPRRRFFALDRHRLAYLNVIEKANCTLCGYANGVIAYVREVAARTEQYWCPIKHARRMPAPHGRYARFAEYGDPSGYRISLQSLRHDLTQSQPEGPRRLKGRPTTAARHRQ